MPLDESASAGRVAVPRRRTLRPYAGGGAIVLTDEYRYMLLRRLAVNPRISQRELARELGISLGKTNYCVTALIAKGLLKVQNFKNSKNKRAYAYLLTAGGIQEKARVTLSFLDSKIAEYAALQREIDVLRREAAIELAFAAAPPAPLRDVERGEA